MIPTVAQTAMYLDSRRLVDRGSRWLLQTRGQGLDVHAEIDRFQPVVSELTPLIPSLLRGAERERLARGTAELVAKGAPGELAEQIAGLLDAFSLLDVTEIALSSGQPAKATAQLYFAVSERYDVDRFLGRITALPRDDRWASLARSALRADLYAALAGITRSVAARTPADVDPVERIVFWEEANAAGLGRARATLRDIALADTFDLATLSVALRVMRQLVPTRS